MNGSAQDVRDGAIELRSSGSEPLLRIPTSEPARLSIGAGTSCAVVVKGEGVAEHHVDVIVERGSAWLCTRAAVLVDGRVVHGWHPLTDGLVLQLGSRTVDVVVAAPPAGAPAKAAAQSAFARPPAEDAPRRVSPPVPARGLWRSPRAWLAVGVAAAAGLLVSAEPTLAPARASRLPQPAPAPTSVAPRAVAPPADARALARKAAAALFAGDHAAAHEAYRALAVSDPRFAPFARALARRATTPDCTGTSCAR